jgi:hypothetical protein
MDGIISVCPSHRNLKSRSRNEQWKESKNVVGKKFPRPPNKIYIEYSAVKNKAGTL